MLKIKSNVNPYLDYSEEDLQLVMKSSKDPVKLAQCREALELRNQPEAFVTVEYTRNHRPKPVYNTNKELLGYRLTGKLVKVTTKNYEGEITYGFGEIKKTARLTIFVFVDEQTLSEMSFAQGQHATFKVAFSEHPVTETKYVLQASTIQTLKKDPESQETLPVWFKEEDGNKIQSISSECPGDGWKPVMSNVYSEVKAEELINTVTVNAASANAVVPNNPLAWLEEGEKHQREVDAHNLAQWTTSRDRATDRNPVSDKMADSVEDTQAQEAEVNV